MVGLGFDAYIAQGGDIGSFITRVLAVRSPHCKAAHINLSVGVFPRDVGMEEELLSEKDKRSVARARDFAALGSAYARMHGTRPATIGLVLASSPIALLAWIGELNVRDNFEVRFISDTAVAGEKFQNWSDKTPPTEEM
jgi:hypothetical protein